MNEPEEQLDAGVVATPGHESRAEVTPAPAPPPPPELAIEARTPEEQAIAEEFVRQKQRLDTWSARLKVAIDRHKAGHRKQARHARYAHTELKHAAARVEALGADMQARGMLKVVQKG